MDPVSGLIDFRSSSLRLSLSPYFAFQRLRCRFVLLFSVFGEEVLLLDFDFLPWLTFLLGLLFWLFGLCEETCLLPFADPLIVVRLVLPFFFTPIGLSGLNSLPFGL